MRKRWGRDEEKMRKRGGNLDYKDKNE